MDSLTHPLVKEDMHSWDTLVLAILLVVKIVDIVVLESSFAFEKSGKGDVVSRLIISEVIIYNALHHDFVNMPL